MKKNRKLTQALRQQAAYKLIMVTHVENTIDTGGHQFFLGITKVIGHILRYKNNSTLSVNHKEETIQGLEENLRGYTVPQLVSEDLKKVRKYHSSLTHLYIKGQLDAPLLNYMDKGTRK